MAAAAPTQETVASTATPSSPAHIGPTSAKLHMASKGIMSQLEQLPVGVLIHICLHVDDPTSLHSLLGTCRQMFKLSRDSQLVSDWLLAHRRPNALVLSCSQGNTAAAMRLLSACNSPIRPTPKSRQMLVSTNSCQLPGAAISQLQQHTHDNSQGMVLTAYSQQIDGVPEAANGGEHGIIDGSCTDSCTNRPLYVNHEDAEAALCAAAAAGHVELVIQLLQWGVPAAGNSSSGRPLTSAAAAGQLTVVKTLITGQLMVFENTSVLACSDQVEASDKARRHSLGTPASQLPTHEQEQAGRTHVRRQLFKQQQKRNAAPVVGDAGNQALQTAAAAGHLQIVQLLLEAGAGTTTAKQFAMAAAAAAGHLDVVQLLVAHRVCWSATYAQALAEAASHNQLHVMEWLWHSLQDSSSYLRTDQQSTIAVDSMNRAAGAHALARAAAAGAVGAMTQLLAWGMDVDDENGAALCSAAAGGHMAAAKLLLEAGADHSVQDGTPVRLACEHGHPDLAKLLLSQGADLPPGAHHLLIAAASQGQLELLRLLMSVGVNAHASDEAALRGAASRGWVDCCRELLQPPCCADVHANEDEALLWAVDNGHEGVVRLLLQHGACAHGDAGQHMLWCAVSRGYYGIVHALMDEGASLITQPE